MQRIQPDDWVNKIKTRWVNPVIETLWQCKVDTAGVIRQLLQFLFRCEMEFYFKEMTAFSFENFSEFTKNFDLLGGSFDPLNIKKLLKDNPSVFAACRSLALLYLDSQTQQQAFPAITAAAIKTCVRELFFDYLNPLSLPNIRNLNKPSISSQKQITQNGELFSQPAELQELIYSPILSANSATVFGRTCKSAYFWQQSKTQCLWVIADDVLITRERGMFDGDVYIVLRRNIPANEIYASLCHTQKKEFLAFKSMYQAVEYCMGLQHGGQMGHADEEGYMPALWLVNYTGHPDDLQFKQEDCELNDTAYCYALRRGNFIATYATVPREAIQPLWGTVLFPHFNQFASYTIFNKLDFRKYVPNETFMDRIEKSICSVM